MNIRNAGLIAASLALITVTGAPTAHADDKVVSPLPPTFLDMCGSASDTYIIPSTPGVDYYVGGSKLNNGVRRVQASSPFVEVFTVAQPGYRLAQQSSWSHQFNTSNADDATGCTAPKPSASVPSATAPSASSTSIAPAPPTTPVETTSAGPSTTTASGSPSTLPRTGAGTNDAAVVAAVAGVGGLGFLGAAGVARRRLRNKR